jgi:hypothetical protein
MTQDYLYDFCQSCDTEGWNYVVIMASPDTNDINVSVNLNNWKGVPGRTCSQDIVNILTCAGVIDSPDSGELPP